MKREIVCLPCRDETKKLFHNSLTPYPGEHVSYRQGKALRDFECDQCGKPIEADGDCCALSMWADYGGVPYQPWEHEFVKSNKEGQTDA